MKPQQIYKDRLILLANKLDTVQQERFDFSRWVGANWGGAKDLSCGTTACGVGWATTMPEFQALGLRLSQVTSEYAAWETPFPALEGTTQRFPWEATCEAMDKIFGLIDLEVEFVFTPRDRVPWDYESGEDEGDTRLSEEATPKELANHIRAFVSGHLEDKYRDFLGFRGEDDNSDDGVEED